MCPGSRHDIIALDYEVKAALVLVLVGGSRVPFHSVLARGKRGHRYLQLSLITYDARLPRANYASGGGPHDRVTA